MLFYDGQMHNPPRLALSFLKSAADAGAVVANYMEATDLVRHEDRVVGVKAFDHLTKGKLEIRGKVVLNASGPWADGGIVGICATWDAALRGLSVALVERGDFAQAASANCFKMVHGGVRYLQHGDLWRTRESSRERSILLRIAPHLVSPLPIVVPTYGNWRKSKSRAYLALDMLFTLPLKTNKPSK